MILSLSFKVLKHQLSLLLFILPGQSYTTKVFYFQSFPNLYNTQPELWTIIHYISKHCCSVSSREKNMNHFFSRFSRDRDSCQCQCQLSWGVLVFSVSNIPQVLVFVAVFLFVFVFVFLLVRSCFLVILIKCLTSLKDCSFKVFSKCICHCHCNCHYNDKSSSLSF